MGMNILKKKYTMYYGHDGMKDSPENYLQHELIE